MEPPSKRSRNNGDVTDVDSKLLILEKEVQRLTSEEQAYYASDDPLVPRMDEHTIPEQGLPARHVKERIQELNELDNRPRLNTSSYVNVVQEPEEQEVALLGMVTNLADGSVYPSSVGMHDAVVNMIARLWNCPEPPKGEKNFSGAGTVGSTEACLLGGLALKFRWRKWYQKKYDLTAEQVLGVVPNIVISSCYQAAWEKFFRYFDVAPRFIKPTLENKMRLDPSKIPELCDEKTIAVVGILGNHYNGAYDPVWEMNDVIEQVNKENDFQIGMHIDAASGGFVAPFQDGMPPFDFRLGSVLSISASGHKFGESSCGTGWLVFRRREDLAEHIAITVSYLGGICDSMTLNFSRPATSVYVQLYKFARLGMSGYRKKVSNQMTIAKFFRDHLKKMRANGKPRFEFLDCGDEHCLPVVAARLNPKLLFNYNSIDLQHAMSEFHWYVSGYNLSFDNFSNGGCVDSLCSDCSEEDTMFRVVFKSNLTMYLAQDLANKMDIVLPVLDKSKGHISFKSVAMKVVKQVQNQKTSVHPAC